MQLVPYTELSDNSNCWLEIYDGPVFDVTQLSIQDRMAKAIRAGSVVCTLLNTPSMSKRYRAVPKAVSDIYAPAQWKDPDTGRIYPKVVTSDSYLGIANALYRGQNPIVTDSATHAVLTNTVVVCEFGAEVTLSNITMAVNPSINVYNSMSGSSKPLEYRDSTGTWKLLATVYGNQSNSYITRNADYSTKMSAVRYTTTFSLMIGFEFYGSWVSTPPRTIDTTQRFAVLYPSYTGQSPTYLTITSDITQSDKYDIYMPDLTVSSNGDRSLPTIYLTNSMIKG